MNKPQWSLTGLFGTLLAFAIAFATWNAFQPNFVLNPLSIVAFTSAITFGSFSCRSCRRPFWIGVGFIGWATVFIPYAPWIGDAYSNIMGNTFGALFPKFLTQEIVLIWYIRSIDFLVAALIATLGGLVVWYVFGRRGDDTTFECVV